MKEDVKNDQKVHQKSKNSKVKQNNSPTYSGSSDVPRYSDDIVNQ